MNDIPRRRFLAATSAAAAAAATVFDLPRVFAEGRAQTDSPFGGLPIGMQSYSLRKFDVNQAIRHIEGLGLHFVEFYSNHLSPQATQQEIDELKTTLEKAGISINAHGVNGFGKDHQQNRNFFEFARRAGIRNLTANPQPDSFDSLEKLVAEYNVRICIHNHGPGALYDGLETVASAVEGRHPLIGACIDTGHVLRSGEDPVQWVRELGPRVFAVHLKDVAEQQKRTHDVVIGTGHLDVVGLFAALREVRFPADGSMSMEYESNPDNPIDDIRQCLEVASRAIAEVNADR